ncbi:MAG: hypothetical protein H6675_10410 [Dehalococcoidia bacterium]|nr:hypothetical protein [Dehalococcoidia bacterium]
MPSASFRSLRTLFAIGALALAGSAVACSDDEGDTGADATTTATATTTVDATGAPSTDATQAPASDATLEAYSALVQDVTEAFPEVTLIEDNGSFSVSDFVGDGRRVLVFGTAAELPTFVEIQQTLRGILEADGWTEDPAYAADGPTATLSVWEKGEDRAVLAAGVSPADPSACPADQIIGECLDSLDPSEIHVQGSITVADR